MLRCSKRAPGRAPKRASLDLRQTASWSLRQISNTSALWLSV